MGKDIFKVVYEIQGDGLALAKAHVKAVQAAERQCFDAAKAVGADGYRSGGRWGKSGIMSFIFKDGVLRKGLKRFSPRGQEQGIDFVPRKDKTGAAWTEAISRAPEIPQDRDIVKQFGWDNDGGLTDGYRIFFGTFSHVQLPTDRYFIRIPRTADDGFEPPETLREITEGEFMRALADHNDRVPK